VVGKNEDVLCEVELNIAHMNLRGLPSKEPTVKKKLVDLDISVCGVAESFTYRHTHLSDDKWQWDPGVENRPSDAHPHPPGGIGMLVRRDISHSMVAAGKYSTWARIEIEGGVPIFLGECYFPQSSNLRKQRAAWSEVTTQATEFQESGHVVLMGDFNAHIGINGGKIDTAGRLLLRQAKSLGLEILNGTDLCTGGHTRVAEQVDGTCVSTTIDFVMVGKPLLPHVAGMKVIEDRMGSDHHMLVLRLIGLHPAPGVKPELREAWRMEDIPHYKELEYKDVVRAYQQAFYTWHNNTKAAIEACGQMDGNEMEKSFQSCLDEVSLKQIGRKFIGPSSSPLMTAQIKALDETRAIRELELKRTLSDPGRTHDDRAAAVHNYRCAKAAVLKAVEVRRESIELQLFKQIEATQSDSKLFWSHVTSIAGPLLNSICPPPMATNTEGKVETDPIAVLKVWKEFSSNIANPGPSEEGIYDEEHKTEVEQRLRDLRRIREYQPELDGPITRQEVFNAIRRLKAGKAPGVDGVTTTILKMAADAVGTSKLKEGNSVVEALVLLFNFVYDNEVWPDRWATGIIFPLYKQGSRLDPGNYRPIALLSVIGKLFGSVVESRISTWSEKHHALADEQGGFRRSRGTPDLIFMLRETILTRKLRGRPTLATFIDARKAYDTVWREGNFVRLHDMGVRGKLWRQLQMMAAEPMSKIRLPFGETEYFRVSRGVAQGAVESPFLYACFINGLADELKRKKLGIVIAGKRTPLLMYADDVVFLADSVDELREMNEVVSDYARRNRYSLNGDKSAVMAFNANDTITRQVNAEPWRLSGEVVKVKDRYKYLGVDILENVLDWSKYFDRAIVKATKVTENLQWACRRVEGLRPRAAAALWKAIVRPVLEYCAEMWAGDIPAKTVAKAEKVQTNFARVMLGLVGCQSISNDALRAEIGMEKLTSRWVKLRLGYWRRINVATEERTLVAIAALRRNHLNWGYKGAASGWMGTTRDLLVKHGMHSHWQNPKLCAAQSKDQWKDVVYEAVESAEEEELRTRFSRMKGAAASRYFRIKNWEEVTADFAVLSGDAGRRGARVIEQYLDDRAEPVGTRLKLMCRLGCLPTMDRVAREEKLPPGHERCRMCDTGKVEDITHLLLTCPAHDRHRAKMLTCVEEALSSVGQPTLAELPPRGQTDILLGQSTRKVAVDCAINKSVTRFIKKAWRTRKWLTSSLNTNFGREDTAWALKAHGDGRRCFRALTPTCIPRSRRKD
jgi:hypothetical protein